MVELVTRVKWQRAWTRLSFCPARNAIWNGTIPLEYCSHCDKFPARMEISKHDIIVLRQQKLRLDQIVAWFQRNAKVETALTACANGADALRTIERIIEKLEAQSKPAQ
jgi:hypothetical protein